MAGKKIGGSFWSLGQLWGSSGFLARNATTCPAPIVLKIRGLPQPQQSFGSPDTLLRLLCGLSGSYETVGHFDFVIEVARHVIRVTTDPLELFGYPSGPL